MKNLFKALANFQNEVPIRHKDTKGYSYTYTDLPEIIRSITPYLKKNDLGFMQLIEGGQLKTIVFHVESGESIEASANIPEEQLKGMNKHQSFGSGLTYMRRYALTCALGLVTDKDMDASTIEDKLSRIENVSELLKLFNSLDKEHQTQFTKVFGDRRQQLEQSNQ